MSISSQACSTQSARPSSRSRPPRATQPMAGARSPRKKSPSACQNAQRAARSASPRRNHAWCALVQASSHSSSLPTMYAATARRSRSSAPLSIGRRICLDDTPRRTSVRQAVPEREQRLLGVVRHVRLLPPHRLHRRRQLERQLAGRREARRRPRRASRRRSRRSCRPARRIAPAISGITAGRSR